MVVYLYLFENVYGCYSTYHQRLQGNYILRSVLCDILGLRNFVAHKLDGLFKQFGSRIWVGDVPSHIQSFIVTMFRFSTVNQKRLQSHIPSSGLVLKTSIIWRSITKAIQHMMDGLSVHLGSGNYSFCFDETSRIYTCLSFG